MATETTVVNVCDRCGSRNNRDDYMKGNSWGQLTVTWSGDRGGRTYDGTAGGITLKGKAWLCESCTEEFLSFATKRRGKQP